MNKVLIVEDDITLAHILKSYFEKHNFLAAYSENAKIAKNWIDEFRPDVIVLDIILPDMSGIEFAKKIREDIKTKKIPIIIITGQLEVENKIKASIDACANLFLTKPIEPQLLCQAATKLVEQYKEEKYKSAFNTKVI